MTEADEKENIHHGATTKSPTGSETEVEILDSSVETAQAEFQYVTGVKLWLVTAAVTFVCFLMSLDMSIIATVSLDCLIS